MAEPIVLKWVIAHQPAYLFVRTAKMFQKHLDRQLPGQFKVEILTLPDYIAQQSPEKQETLSVSLGDDNGLIKGNWKRGDRKTLMAKWRTFFNDLKEGAFHLSQTQVSTIGVHLEKRFQTLDLPFLFDSHEHVNRTLGGRIGQKFNEKLSETGVRGLAFTYSGGYRILGSNKEIKSLADIAEGQLTSVPMTRAMFEKVGIDASTDSTLREIQETADQPGTGDTVETTYLRFNGKHVLKTNHSMFLTTIMVSGKLFDSLNKEQQKAFRIAARIASEQERKWSVEDAEKYEQEAAEKGITITDASDADMSVLKEMQTASYAHAVKMEPSFKPIIEDIRMLND